jgi:1,4-alpha-glucan branching enzyme
MTKMPETLLKTATALLATALLCLPPATAVAAEEEIPTTFSYHDPNATTVGVAGEFSNWNILPMTKGADGTWSRTVYLRPGYYGYKFVVNGEWVFDPKNPARKLVNDIENSAISVGGVQPPAAAAPAAPGNVAVTFSFSDPAARTVHLAGEFNRWLDNVAGRVTGHEEWLMKNDGAGNWTYTAHLPPGRHKFKYVINGGERWEVDPRMPVAPDGNSIIEVKAPAATAPAVAAPAATAPTEAGIPTTFTYADPAASAVFLAGEFNRWSATANPMRKDEFGVWTTTVPLKPGRYQYKFVVDGTWKEDPANPETVDDGFGGKNSVKTVSP